MVKGASRRKFLKRVTGSLAATSTLSSPLFHVHAATADSDSFWQMVSLAVSFQGGKGAHECSQSVPFTLFRV